VCRASGDVNGDRIVCVSDAVEIALWLIESPSVIDTQPLARNAALITEQSKAANKPAIADMHEILKHISGLESGVNAETAGTIGSCKCCCTVCLRPVEPNEIGGTYACICLGIGNVTRVGKVSMQDALEILKHLAKMDSMLSSCYLESIFDGYKCDNDDCRWHLSFNAALITPASKSAGKPAIADVLEILKHLAKMESMIKE